MAFLFIARFRPERYDMLSRRGELKEREYGFMRTDAQEAARSVSEQLFGAVYEHVNRKYVEDNWNGHGRIIEESPNGESEGGMVTIIKEPTSGIKFMSAHVFQYSPGRLDKLGFMVIVNNANYAKLLKLLGWPRGELMQVYEMEIIPLNDDEEDGDTKDIYAYMTPAYWGPTFSV